MASTIGESRKTCQVQSYPLRLPRPWIQTSSLQHIGSRTPARLHAQAACECLSRYDTILQLFIGSLRSRSTNVALICEICQKKPVSGNNVSHANNKTRRVFNPNIQTVRAVVGKSHKRIRVCTRCLRSGLVRKAV